MLEKIIYTIKKPIIIQYGKATKNIIESFEIIIIKYFYKM